MRTKKRGVSPRRSTKSSTPWRSDAFCSFPANMKATNCPAFTSFPGNCSKLRTLLVQFLVDLARPSHLGTNPFLRGLLFHRCAARRGGRRGGGAGRSGGRAGRRIMIRARRKFSAAWVRRSGRRRVAVRSGGSRRVPQWVFLTSLFNDVLVKDRVALATSGSSSRVNLLRRIALGAALFLAADLPDRLRRFVFPQPCAGDPRARRGRRPEHAANREQPSGRDRRSEKAGKSAQRTRRSFRLRRKWCAPGACAGVCT